MCIRSNNINSQHLLSTYFLPGTFLSVLHACTHFNHPSESRSSRFSYSDFTDREMESQRGSRACPSSHGQWVRGADGQSQCCSRSEARPGGSISCPVSPRGRGAEGLGERNLSCRPQAASALERHHVCPARTVTTAPSIYLKCLFTDLPSLEYPSQPMYIPNRSCPWWFITSLSLYLAPPSLISVLTSIYWAPVGAPKLS